MWKIKQIAEADFGCEERMPGEKLKCLVILEDESGNVRCLETEDEWLTEQGLDEGSEWMERLNEISTSALLSNLFSGHIQMIFFPVNEL